ncbi:MAG TPA: hypothetical protein VHP13_07260 [Gammaproteobacteria bacterium]|jgi:hypothetical protein|nr:hypothetical protein [Gammaproteobacteria bacterium]
MQSRVFLQRIPCRMFLVALAALLACACVPKEINRYLGKDPKQVYGPKYLVDQDTMQFDESHPGVDWGMSLVWQGDHYLLSADQNTTPKQLTQVWQVVAVQDVPLLKAGQMFALGNCMDDGAPNSRVVAVVDYDPDKQWFDRFESAWAYDYARNAFLPYPTAHLLCFNARYGLGLDAPPPAATSTLPAIAPPAPVTLAPPASHPF